ncbi:hypothetical protein B7R78_0018130 [Ralstonia solanacearum]|uniref:imm11 family protein n=1 Tax=Ralstonia solanacearum TaxID=305 RepID=UPI001144EADB|nr:DUF1629 domain-containing protein [Ralstonia solanacearum]MBT1538946.1 hypothetical protein [Ralstonia solanacearum]
MTEIYVIGKDDKFPTLVQDESDGELTADNDFALRAGSIEMHGVKFGDDYLPIRLKIANEDRKKKGTSDVQTHFMSFIILYRQAVEALSDLLDGAGQMLPIDDRYPDLQGFHVTRIVRDAVDFDRSEYVVYPRGTLIRKTVLLKERVADVPIFKIQEDPTRVFISDVFRRRVEEKKLKGFSFAIKVELT